MALLFLKCSPPYEFYVHPKNAILTSCNERNIGGFILYSKDFRFDYKLKSKKRITSVNLLQIDSSDFRIFSYEPINELKNNIMFEPNVPYLIRVDGSGDRDGYEIEFMFDEKLQLKYVNNDTRKCWD